MLVLLRALVLVVQYQLHLVLEEQQRAMVGRLVYRLGAGKMETLQEVQ
jgi:GH24 family phage-related lysozyme (muramidase)